MDWESDYRTTSPLKIIFKALGGLALVFGVYLLLAKFDVWHHPSIDAKIDSYSSKIKGLVGSDSKESEAADESLEPVEIDGENPDSEAEEAPEGD